MYAYSLIDSNRFSLHLPGNIILPVFAVVLAVMFLSFVINLLFGGAVDTFRRIPVRSMIASVAFVAVMGVGLCVAGSTRYRCDWQGLQVGIGNVFVHGMLFVVLVEHLSQPREADRFVWYVIVYSAIVVVAAVIS
jgi:hypothetical protein